MSGLEHVASAARSSAGALSLALLVYPGIAGCSEGQGRPENTFSATSPSSTESGPSETGSSGPSSGDGDPSTGDGDGDGDLGDPPMIVSTVPAAGATGVDPNAALVVTFAAAMDPDLITTNSGAMTCSGALQLSDDGFATCVQMDVNVSAANGDTEFSFRPQAELKPQRTYEIRVADFVTTASGAPLGEPWVIESPFTTRYYRHVEIDGENDFDIGDESFATTSPGFTAYVGWDDAYLYLALEGSDIVESDPNTFVFAYLGGEPGTMMGVDYQGQAPALPFAARWHPRWKADGTYTNVQEFGGAWVDTALPLLGPDDYIQVNEYIEMRLARDLIGSPSILPVVLGIVREGPGGATFAGLPANAFNDGLDPDFASYYAFDLDGTTAPAEHTPLP